MGHLMNKKTLLLISAGAIGLLLVGLLVSSIGNVGVRRVGPSGARIEISVSEPVLVGVPVVLRWTAPPNALSRAVEFVARGPLESAVIGQAEADALQAQVTIPCMFADDAQIGLVMRDAATGRVLASLTVSTLPAGPDCVQ